VVLGLCIVSLIGERGNVLVICICAYVTQPSGRAVVAPLIAQFLFLAHLKSSSLIKCEQTWDVT